MFKLRNLLGVGLALVVMLALMTTGAWAQPALQATSTPEATATSVITSTATLSATAVATAAATSTGVAPTVSPVSTPGTLPTTGDSDSGAAALSLIVVAIGAVLVLGALGLALSRRPE